ncbi:MAG TPA: protein phosphatase 2C domain-containing protein [Gemmatimonadales bacterium]|jgi:protein phosphatase
MTTIPSRKPTDDEIDVYGLTHPGKMRKTNQDHFLLATLNRHLEVLSTSLPSTTMPGADARLAFLAMIADGVGGAANGEQASRLALEEATQYLSQCTDCYYQADAGEATFIETLQSAATRCHDRVVATAAENPDDRGMATTLTLWIGVWPWAYVLQVGDSRYYLYRDGALTQLTRDQTMAQELVDQGVLARSVAFSSRWANTLSSSIGGRQTAPVVTRVPSDWRYIHLLCSDGLTKHVSDERIAERLRTMTSAKQVCEDLLQDALDGGGTDNISIIVGRAEERKEQQA